MRTLFKSKKFLFISLIASSALLFPLASCSTITHSKTYEFDRQKYVILDEEYLSFEINDDDDAVITGVLTQFLDSRNKYSLSIPDSYKAHVVTGIADEAFKGYSSIYNFVVIPESVTSIGASAFADCVNIKSFEVQGPARIGELAFSNCIGLEQLTFANDRITFPQSITEGDAWINTITTTCGASPDTGVLIKNMPNTNVGIFLRIMVDNTTVVPDSAFEWCERLAKVEFAYGITMIGYKTFKDCHNLNYLTILYLPESIATIKSYAFYNCLSIPRIRMSKFVNRVEEYTFYNCKKLTNINLGLIEYIGDYAFYQCMALATSGYDTDPESSTTTLFSIFKAKTIGKYAFYNCAFQAPKYSEELTKIGDYAFFGVKNLDYWDITNINGVGAKTFDSSGIKTFDIDINSSSTSLQFLKTSTFNPGTTFNLYSKTPNTRIPANAFENIKGVTNIVIGNNITSIGANAFKNCRDLTYFNIPNSVTTIGLSIFANCANLRKIYISSNKPEIVTSANLTQGLTNVELTIDAPSVVSQAFRNDTAVKKIIFTDRVVSFGDYAFKGSGLREIYIHDQVNTWGIDTFADLTNAVFELNLQNPSLIPKRAFQNAPLAATVHIPYTVEVVGENAFFNASVTSFALKDTMNIDDDSSRIWKMEDYAFSGTNCESFTVPTQVTHLGKYVFSNSTRLTTFNFGWLDTEKHVKNGDISPVSLANILSPDSPVLYQTTVKLPAGTDPSNPLGSGVNLQTYTLNADNGKIVRAVAKKDLKWYEIYFVGIDISYRARYLRDETVKSLILAMGIDIYAVRTGYWRFESNNYDLVTNTTLPSSATNPAGYQFCVSSAKYYDFAIADIDFHGRHLNYGGIY